MCKGHTMLESVENVDDAGVCQYWSGVSVSKAFLMLSKKAEKAVAMAKEVQKRQKEQRNTYKARKHRPEVAPQMSEGDPWPEERRVRLSGG